MMKQALTNIAQSRLIDAPASRSDNRSLFSSKCRASAPGLFFEVRA